MSVSLLLKEVLLVDPSTSTERQVDVRIKDGKIAEIGEVKTQLRSPSEVEVDASGCWLTPGLIDMHTHLRDFAQSDKENISSGTAAAACGGFTTMLAMANSHPPLDNGSLLTTLQHKLTESACIEVLPACCVTRGMQGAELTNMVELATMGAAAFSDDGLPITNLEVLRRALRYCSLTGKIIISHAEDKNLSGHGVMHQSSKSTLLGLAPYPGCAETAAIAAQIEIARETGERLHFTHVTMARSVELIRAARAVGIRVTGDVTPHHLSLTVDDINEYNPSFKMNPPLRTVDDIAALIEGLRDGTLSAIATDHAPHTRLEKQCCFDAAPFGVTGLETAIPLTLAVLIHSGILSPSIYIQLMTVGPAEILGITTPAIGVGSDSFVLIDPKHEWVYTPAQGYSLGSNSPFDGRSLKGRAILTVYKGSVVWRDTGHRAMKVLDASKTAQSAYKC